MVLILSHCSFVMYVHRKLLSGYGIDAVASHGPSESNVVFLFFSSDIVGRFISKYVYNRKLNSINYMTERGKNVLPS